MDSRFIKTATRVEGPSDSSDDALHDVADASLAMQGHCIDSRYTIGEVSDTTGISAFTIRYYDKCGFFPGLHRNRRGVRSFSDADVAQLHLVEALRKSGLSIEGIQYYVKLAKRGATTQKERLAILQAQETVLEYQRDELEVSLQRLHAATMDLSASLQPMAPNEVA